MPKQTPQEFFYEHAGYSIRSGETEEQGRTRGATQLAAAEEWAGENCLAFHWDYDDITNREFTDEGNEYRLWFCVARDESGKVIQSLSGIDFGEGGEPWGDSYRRVVEAELALEAMPTGDQS